MTITKAEYNREYRLKNRERIYSQNKQWRLNNKEKLSVYLKKWNLDNKYRVLELRKKALIRVGKGIIGCVRCGCKDIRFLEINHKNGGGRKEVKLRRSKTIYGVINNGKRDITDLELLCRPCNHIHYLELKHKEPIPLITKYINEDWKLEL